MSQDYNNPAFKKLLQKLQEESWQLELLISGFAIFGLFQATTPLSIASQEARNNEHLFLFVILIVATVSCYILLFNLLLHVILRGLWIGALGLRYVSGDIDYEELNYSQKFTTYLKHKIGSFDRYIGNLENYCSVIFAISFLLIFYVIAFTLTFTSIGLIAYYLLDNKTNSYEWIGVPLILFIVFGMLFTFIDFLTQGWLKKKKWTSTIYFPIYWVFSFITLSFLYRPLVYNFLDNKFGRRISFALVPIYFLILMATSFNYKLSNYLELGLNSNAYTANKVNYEDLLDKEKGQFIRTASIPSKVITDRYLKVFVLYSENTEDIIFEFRPDLKPDDDTRGLGTEMNFSNDFSELRKRDSLRPEYMKTLNSIYNFKIDSVTYKPQFVLTESTTEQFGFETYLDLKNVPNGKHQLNVIRKSLRKKDTVESTRVRIPFWYFKD
ncbi:hypothetical protein SAMN04515667_2840 [Formosa sp. Hel1_31_208]|uniref:hypothetical protein n=1 Tax=Formosa sp. Hel1_31_208 TaxID=1798225 RepID=UPI00087D34A7|nr:hypothetical protein [Formosa sp. Hel1_31_208]SDS72703.1 hypothetical protein SAMN04515667_2840 [Formosa sp. Hel1_31_208]